ncbi:class I SAM-dependent RNA methyltransferase [Pseudenhygromyxa sp. WMMC2535]|uniref:class I SAM-dependent RNA methyltransferase n=1 Tax=Pseudenhygromyxa sp. WMMC2535 TaxID=2712867 RepID=UPI001554C824|nr:TRAM domain-containing protein [Pseudenhygromyxa sp. WMMC2535]NVB38301.1 class I SAM-dependent RNA methyltransferase [Pseudenhygromyxa sp. WMMC2535]
MRPTDAPKVGDELEVEITGISSRGDGQATLGERTLLVPGALPGDVAKVRIEAVARHQPRIHGRLSALVRLAAQRRALPCARHRDYRGSVEQARLESTRSTCEGCPLMAVEISAQREAKRELVVREHGLALAPGSVRGGEEFGYRWSSKRVVSGRPGALIFGSREGGRGGKPFVADMRGCLVDHPKIVAVFDALQAQAEALGIEPWRGRDQAKGDLRYLWAKTDGERVLLTLITGSEDSPAARQLGPWAAAREDVAGVAWSVQSGEQNAIRGDAPRPLGGEQRLRVPFFSAGEFSEGEDDVSVGELGPSAVEVGPLGFLQPNPAVAALAYADLVRDTSGELAMDLYAGAGLTTAALRRRFAKVVPCEAYPESAAALGVAPTEVADFLDSWTGAGEARPELVVANPPRAGLGARVCESLRRLGAPRLHLMSCNAKTLAEDLERLGPDYEVVELLAHDTLPQTPHLELVARLERRSV